MNNMFPSAGTSHQSWSHEHKPRTFGDGQYYDALRPLQQRIGTKLLKEWDIVLRKLDIPYFLHAGTLLGSVRHQGWIPWDDDVDVLIRRNDFDALLQAHIEWPEGMQLLFSGRFGVTPRFAYLCSLVDGRDPIGIDVFVVEDFPDSRIQRWCYCATLRAAELLEASRTHVADRPDQGGGLLKRAVWGFGYYFPISTRRRVEWLRRARTIYREVPGQELFIVGHPRGLRNVIKRSWLSSLEYGIFEGDRYPIPGDHRAFLTALYGPDFLKPPPIEKRHSHPSRAVCLSLEGKDYCLVRQPDDVESKLGGRRPLEGCLWP